MKSIHEIRAGAGVAGAMLLGIAAIEFFAAPRGPVGANILTALIGIAMLIVSTVGLRSE
jgi:hypothetical protein